MKLFIDARLWGLENAGIGRYTVNLVNNLAKIDQENEYYIALRANYFHQINLTKNFTKVMADFRAYSVAEQAAMSKIINRYHPDLVHFPHFNIPLIYNGNYLV